MFIKLNCGAIFNTNHITGINPCESFKNAYGIEITYKLYTSDGTCWYLSDDDYSDIIKMLNPKGVNRKSQQVMKEWKNR